MAAIDPLPSGLWRARVRRAGLPSRSKSFSRKRDAEAWARMVERQQDEGTWHANAEAERTDLRAALTRYEREVTPGKKSAVGERSLLTIVRADAGKLQLLGKPLARVDGADISDLRDAWKGDGVKPATVKRRMALLSHLFTTAAKEWRMPGLHNPVRDVKLDEVRDARTRGVSAAELDAILAATQSRELPDFARLAVETAMRRGELHALLWSNVNLRDRTAFLPSTKNGSTRTVPLTTRAAAILKGRPGPHRGPVFEMTADGFSKAFRKARKRARARYVAQCKKAGKAPDAGFLTGARLHDERHEATRRLAGKLHVLDLAAVTGHKDLRMLQRYYHADAKALAKKIG
jgi:integrase